MADPFGDSEDEAGKSELRVNAAFASKHTNENARRALQRRASTLGRMDVPLPVLRSFVRAIAAVCNTAPTSARFHASVPAVAAAVLRNVGMPRAAEQCLETSSHDSAAAYSAAAQSSADALGVLKPVRNAARNLVAAMRTQWHAGGHKLSGSIREHSDAGEPQPRKRPRTQLSSGPASGASSVRSEASRTMPAGIAEVSSSFYSKAAGTESDASAAEHASSPSPPHTRTRADSHTRAAARPAASAKKKLHGRGCGRGRGLDPRTGEPAFGDKHPSWRAAAVASARVRKAVTKALRAGHAPPVEVRE